MRLRSIDYLFVVCAIVNTGSIVLIFFQKVEGDTLIQVLGYATAANTGLIGLAQGSKQDLEGDK